MLTDETTPIIKSQIPHIPPLILLLDLLKNAIWGVTGTKNL